MLLQSRLFSIVVLSTSVLATIAAQGGQAVPALELGKPVDRELAGDQAHTYSVALRAGQYLHVVVDQRGIDVVVTLVGPDGQTLAEVDSPNGMQGSEPVSFVTEVSGSYRVEVRSLEKTAAAGRYEVKIDVLRAASDQDRSRIAGEQAFAQAERLSRQRTAESRRSALTAYERSLPLFRAAGDGNQEALTFNAIGDVYGALGDAPKALAAYMQALPLNRALGDRAGEATTLNNVGSAYNELGDHRNALESLAQALTLFRSVGDRSGEASALGNIGFAHLATGEHQKALDVFNQVLPIFRAVGDRSAEAAVLSNIGGVYATTGRKSAALDSWAQALELSRAIGDRTSEATLLSNLAAVSDELGDAQKALDYLAQALPLHRAVGNRRGEASTLSNIASVHLDQGDPQTALEYFSQSLLLRRAVGDRAGEASTLNGIGRLYRGLGRQQEALETFARALEIRRAVGDRRGEATTLSNIGVVYDELGERQRALDYGEQALTLRRAVGDREGEASTLSNIGVLYSGLGEKQKALDYYGQALPLNRAVGDRGGEATTLTNIGMEHFVLGDKMRALDLLEQGLALYRAIGDRRNEAQVLTHIGSVYDSLSDRQTALDYFTQALPIRRAVGDRGGEATTLNNIGAAYGALGDKQKALEYYTQALPLYRAAGALGGEATGFYNLARVQRSNGDALAALSSIDAALAIAESLRAKIGSQALRSSYFSTIQQYYEFDVDLLMQMHKETPSAGYDGKALQASERARARSLLETLAEAKADIRQGVDAALLARERTQLSQINATAQQQAQLLSRPHSDAQAAAIAKALDVLTTAFQQTEAAIRTTSPRYAALTQPQPLTLQETQRALDADTVLLEYALGVDRSYLWAVTPTSTASFELPKRAEIEVLARQYYDQLTARNHHPAGETAEAWRVRIAAADRAVSTTAATLSRMILGPAQALLSGKRLVIAPVGALQYVPFGALPVPTVVGTTSTPIAARHEVVILPSISALAMQRQNQEARPRPAKTVMVLADPVFSASDPRVTSIGRPASPPPAPTETQGPMGRDLERAAGEAGVAAAGGALPRLRFSRDEASAILGLAARDRRLSALDFDATVGLVTGTQLGDYQILHVASHAFLNGDHPELSGIALSMVDVQGRPLDGFLRLNGIYNLSLSADLVVLSACQTALGRDIGGEGLVGLTRGFMYAGASRVVGSLWKVDDEATAQLMTFFYQRLLGKEQMRPGAALRAAQEAMRRSPRWQSPYYWAAFVLQGEWR